MTEQKAAPTHNIEAEQALIGAALIDNDVLDRCRGLVKPEHFYDGLHSRIFHNMLKRQERGERSSAVLLRPTFEGDRDIDEVGGPAYLARLAGAAVSLMAAPDHASHIKDLWARREVRSLLSEARDALDSADDMGAICERMEDQFARVNALARPEERGHSWRRALSDMVDKVVSAYQTDGVPGITTGIAPLDDLTGGMIAPEVWMIAARTSMGKSAVALHIALKQAQSGLGVLIESMEMEPAEMAMRMVSALCHQKGHRIEHSSMRRGSLSEAEMRTVLEATREFEKLPIIITPSKMRSSGALMAEARAAERAFADRKDDPVKMGTIIIDYIQRMRVSGSDGRVDEITEAMRIAKDMASNHACPVIPLAQINRGSDLRATEGKGSIPRPRLTDLKGAGALEEDSDVVMILHRDEYYVSKWHPTTSEGHAEKARILDRCRGKMDIYVDKFRNGEPSEIEVKIDLGTNTISSEPEVQQDRMNFG